MILEQPNFLIQILKRIFQFVIDTNAQYIIILLFSLLSKIWNLFKNSPPLHDIFDGGEFRLTEGGEFIRVEQSGIKINKFLNKII